MSSADCGTDEDGHLYSVYLSFVAVVEGGFLSCQPSLRLLDTAAGDVRMEGCRRHRTKEPTKQDRLGSKALANLSYHLLSCLACRAALIFLPVSVIFTIITTTTMPFPWFFFHSVNPTNFRIHVFSLSISLSLT